VAVVRAVTFVAPAATALPTDLAESAIHEHAEHTVEFAAVMLPVALTDIGTSLRFFRDDYCNGKMLARAIDKCKVKARLVYFFHHRPSKPCQYKPSHQFLYPIEQHKILLMATLSQVVNYFVWKLHINCLWFI
jgi:hypothetical protein